LAREANEEEAVALAIECLGWVAAGQGILDRAEDLAKEALTRWRRLEEVGRTGETLLLLGHVNRRRGEFDQAEVLLSEALEVVRAKGSDIAIAAVLDGLGQCAVERGDHCQAARLLVASLAIAREVEDPTVLGGNLLDLGSLAIAVGRAEQGVRLFGAAEALAERRGLNPIPADWERIERDLDVARAVLSAATFGAAWEAGRALPLDQAIAEAQAVAESAQVPAIASASVRPQGYGEGGAGVGLTRREREIVRLVAEGQTDREIAATLSIGERTVEWHLTNAFNKLGVNTRAAAATTALRRGLI
jgi:non-specific serine/threonine protein kinase